MKRIVIISLLVTNIFAAEQYGIVKPFWLNLHSTPKAIKTNIVGAIKQGDTVNVLIKKRNWCKVNRKKESYVDCRYLEIHNVPIKKIQQKLENKPIFLSIEEKFIIKLIDKINFLESQINILKKKLNKEEINE